jgi:formiminoglutamase
MLTPASLPEFPPSRSDDPRLNEIIASGPGTSTPLQAGQAVLIGFPIDDGVQRNGGRVGAAQAPDAIRAVLYRLTPADAPSGQDIRRLSVLDLGNLRPLATLEDSQAALGSVVGQVLEAGAVPIILGGGHETAYGHYLGYCNAGMRPSIVNLDAHLDVRPSIGGRGTSGTSFRQAIEHATNPLRPGRYTCLGVQPPQVSAEHWNYCHRRGDLLTPADDMRGKCAEFFERACSTLGQFGEPIYLSIDADVVSTADVPGVSAPNPAGLAGHELLTCARQAGVNPAVHSLDLVEINPVYDIDQRSSRWAATMVWQFLIGLLGRQSALSK